MHLIILYSLKDGVSRSDFLNWVHTTDYPTMRELSRIKSFKTYQSNKLLIGEGSPSVGYVEMFEIPDLDGFIAEDLGGDRVQSIMGQFMGFAEAPEFIISDEVK